MPALTGGTAEMAGTCCAAAFERTASSHRKTQSLCTETSTTGEEGDPTIFLPSITSPAALANIGQVPLSGGFLQTIWNHADSTKSTPPFNSSMTGNETTCLSEQRNTFTSDFQNHIGWGGRHDIVWGLSYRFSASRSDGDLTFSLIPANLNTQVFGAFFQDEIAIVPNRLFLTVGSKLEHDHFSGFNLEPTARIAWAPTGHHMVWAAISQQIGAGRDRHGCPTKLRGVHGLGRNSHRDQFFRQSAHQG